VSGKNSNAWACPRFGDPKESPHNQLVEDGKKTEQKVAVMSGEEFHCKICFKARSSKLCFPLLFALEKDAVYFPLRWVYTWYSEKDITVKRAAPPKKTEVKAMAPKTSPRQRQQRIWG
jgi:hypothetical protein